MAAIFGLPYQNSTVDFLGRVMQAPIKSSQLLLFHKAPYSVNKEVGFDPSFR
jgi:hypothetical protein